MSTDEIRSIEYALAKQVPDMQRGCTIETNYGGIRLDPADAAQVSALVERLLRAKLKRISK